MDLRELKEGCRIGGTAAGWRAEAAGSAAGWVVGTAGTAASKTKRH